MINTNMPLFDKVPPIPYDITDQVVNVQFIAALESANSIALVPNKDLTGIKSILLLHKKDNTISFASDLTGFVALKKTYFSLFMGFMTIKDTFYLVFAEKVRCQKFGRFGVFDIQSVLVYALKDFSLQLEITNILSAYYKLGFLFSYEMDLTDSGNYRAAFDFGANPFKHRKNFLYFANRVLISTCISSQNKEWAIPIIYGQLYQERLKFVEGQNNQVYFLFKASVLDVNPRYKEDNELLEDFYCPTSFNVIDTFMIDELEVKSFGVIFNDFPGVTRKMKSKTKSDYFSTSVNSKKLTKYFEFMRYFHHCPAFVFSGKQEQLDLMKAVGEIRQVDDKLKSIIKVFMMVKGEGIKELLHLSGIIIDKLNCIDLVGEDDSKNFVTSNVSICSERPIEEMEECFCLLYHNYIKADIIRKRVTTKRKCRLSGEELRYEDEISIKHHITHKNTVKSLFKLIKDSSAKLIKKEHLMRNSVKELNTKIDMAQLLKYIYGPKNSISKGYIKILSKHNIPVYKTREINLCIITHNCGGSSPNNQIMAQLQYNNMEAIHKSDLLIIGLQEIVEMKSKNWGNIITNNNKQFLTPWVEAFSHLFVEFDILTHVSMLGLFLIVFIRKSVSHIYDVSIHELELIKLGTMNLANKGGIFLRFKINYEQIGIFNCHLAAGTNTKNCQKRQDNILALANFLNSQPGISLSFIIGDMNFRTNITCSEASDLIDKFMKDASHEETHSHLAKLLAVDELSEFMKMTTGTSLEQYSEAPIRFLPSYKWNVGKNDYNFSNSKRAPSW